MKKSLFYIALASAAVFGCNNPMDVNPDVPMEERVIVYGGEGALITSTGDDGADGDALKSTYKWSAEETTISITANIDVTECTGFEIGHFVLPMGTINDFIGGFVSELDESTFVCYNADGSVVETMTSYKPGMWIDADGNAAEWDTGCAFWQWYVWGGKADKKGNTIGYDYDYSDKVGRFVIGTNSGNVGNAVGKTIVSKSKLTVGDQVFDFIVTFIFEGELPEPPESEGYIEEYMEASADYPYGSGVWGNHQYHWYFDEAGLNVDVDTYVPGLEDWGYLGIVIPPDVMTAYLGIADINQLTDLGYFYPLAADGTALSSWTSYEPGEWVDMNGDPYNWEAEKTAGMFWQYQFGDNKYDGHFTEGLLVIGGNPGTYAQLAGTTVTSKAKMGDKLLTVSVNYHDSYPTSKSGIVGPHSYSWELLDNAVNIVANCSKSHLDDSWNWFGFCINEAYINDKYGIDIDAASQDITQFYPLAPDGTPYSSWSSYVPGEWLNVDGTESDYTAGTAFWQYYTYQEYDYAIPNLVLIGNNSGNAAAQNVGDSIVSKAKLGDIDWTVTINIVE